MNIYEQLFDHVFVVSLARCTDRREHLANQFLELGISNYSFFDATDKTDDAVAKAFEADQVFTYPPCFRCGEDECNCANNVLIEPQIATFITYLRLWKFISQNPGGRFLIVEDDIKIHSYSERVLQEIYNWVRLGELPFQRDKICMLRLGWALSEDHRNASPVYFDNSLKMANPCHAITKGFAVVMLDRFVRFDHTVDVYQHHLAVKPNESFTVYPPVASELSWSTGQFQSEIHPKPVRSQYLRSIGNEELALTNDLMIRLHKARINPDS